MADSSKDLARRLRRLEALVAAVLGTGDTKAVATALRHLLSPHGKSAQSDIDDMIDLARDSRLSRSTVQVQNTVIGLQQRYETLERAVFSRMTLDALDVDTAALRAPRFLPVRVYVSSDHIDTLSSVSNSVDAIADILGFNGKHLATTELGSWWSRWLARSRETLSRREVAERLQKLERAAEVQILHRPQADVDEKLVNAVAKLNRSFKGIPNAAVQIGTVLFLKTTDPMGAERVLVRTLSQKELIAIEQSDRTLLSDPLALEKILDDVREGRRELPE